MKDKISTLFSFPSPPRITGLLHNCLLNCGLPTILRGIEILADEEASASISTMDDAFLVLDSFKRLKSLFADYYGFPDDETFGFIAFFNTLKDYSFYALELLFLPILRQFIVENCDLTLDTHYFGDIQKDGCYNYLHYTDASPLYFQYFGIFIEIYEHREDESYTQIPYDKQRFDDTLYPFKEQPKISIYFKDAHYELQPFENLALANQIFNEDIQKLPDVLQELHANLSFSDSASQTNHALQTMRTKMTGFFNPTSSFIDDVSNAPISTTNAIIIGAEVLTFLSGAGIIIGTLALVGLFSTIVAATVGVALVASSAITFGFSLSTVVFFSAQKNAEKDGFEEFSEVDLSDMSLS